MKITIRPATPDDADILSRVAYSAKAHWGYSDHLMEIWKPQFDFPPSYFEEREGLVAEIDGGLVAFYTIEEKDSNGWIENLWVHPEYMGKGVGKQLFLDAVSRSRQKGHLILRLESDPNAQSFYEHMGMQKVGDSSYPVEGQPRTLPVMQLVL